MPEDDASDIEYELEIEANEIFDSDEESEEESENAPTQAADDFLLGKDTKGVPSGVQLNPLQ